MKQSNYPILIQGLKGLCGVDVCFSYREQEDHSVAGDSEAERYISGTSYDENADYIFFAREIDDHFGVEGKKIAEFCTGPGKLSHEISKLEPESVIGIDGSQCMIEHARTLRGAGNLKYVCEDLFDLSLSLKNCDIVVCQNSLHHFDDTELIQFFNAGLNILKPGGVLYISDYKRESIDPEIMAQRLESTNEIVRDDLIATFKASFTRYELMSLLNQYGKEIDYEVYFPDKEYEKIKKYNDFNMIIERDPHPHYLDYKLSLRIKITKL